MKTDAWIDTYIKPSMMREIMYKPDAGMTIGLLILSGLGLFSWKMWMHCNEVIDAWIC